MGEWSWLATHWTHILDFLSSPLVWRGEIDSTITIVVHFGAFWSSVQMRAMPISQANGREKVSKNLCRALHVSYSCSQIGKIEKPFCCIHNACLRNKIFSPFLITCCIPFIRLPNLPVSFLFFALGPSPALVWLCSVSCHLPLLIALCLCVPLAPQGCCITQ